MSKNKVIVGDPEKNIKKLSEKFDLIFADLPLSLAPRSNFEYGGLKLKARKNWIIIFKSLLHLSEKGVGIFVVEPSFLRIFNLEKLNQFGYHINSVFQIPKDSFQHFTSIRPLIISVSKVETEKYFVCELDKLSNYSMIIKNLMENSSVSLGEGLFVLKEKFNGFDSYNISKQLEMLGSQYKEYKKFTISEISEEIRGSKLIEDRVDSVYIPRVGVKVVADLKITTVKHNNLIQVILNTNIVNPDYLALFFNSEIGRLNLDMIRVGATIKSINKKDLNSLEIALPGLPIQKQIVSAIKKISHLEKRIVEFRNEIAFNPDSVEVIGVDLDRVLNSLNLLNESDHILALIREGENQEIEFKSTMRTSIENKSIPSKEIEKSVMKTIGAFMNTVGGTLLIGVNDKGQIIGLDHDRFSSDDDYLKHFNNLLKRDIEEFYNLVDFKIVKVQKKKVFRILVSKSDKAVFIRNEEFYIRRNPATDRLTGKKLLDYVKDRFPD